jgi:hypothetical protein
MEIPSVMLKIFSADIIENEGLAFPVKVELLDAGLNPIFETIATGKDEDLNYLFSHDRFIAGTVAQPTSFSARFTAADKSFVREFPA